MDRLATLALDAARTAGADFADCRVAEDRTEEIAVRTGEVQVESGESAGVGIRAVVGTGQGFGATADLTPAGLERASRAAVAAARAADAGPGGSAPIAAEPAHRAAWATPVICDPFTVPLEEKVGLLVGVDRVLRRDARIRSTTCTIVQRRRHQLYASTAGARIDQVLLRCGGGAEAIAVHAGEVQRRSWPAPFGGQHAGGGYEVVLGLRLGAHAERIREEAIALCTAPVCPAGTVDLVLGSHQVALQIHESVGHPLEFDRILGHEEGFAGRSFVTPEMRGTFTYASPQVTFVADATLPGGMATAAYDDEGVAAQRFEPVREGRLLECYTDRSVARAAGAERSRGCARAESWAHVPMVRIPNLSLAPGTWRLPDLLADTGRGIFMDVNRSWSIDQLRLNFQFACEVGHEIVDGKLGRLLRHPTYQGITPEFWRSCDAVCGPEEWVMWGTPNCGKGEPMQVMYVGHGTAPARFREVNVTGVHR